MFDELPDKVKQGLKAFNQGNFYAAHDYFEDAWRATRHPNREFYRALLHLSGGYYRLTQNRPGAAQKFFQRSLHWLGHFPSPYFDIDVFALKNHVQKLINCIQSGQTSSSLLTNNRYQIPYPNQETSS